MTDTLLADLLATPTPPPVSSRQADPERDYTRQIEVSGDAAEVTVRGPAEMDPDSSAADVLRAHHLDPADWDVKAFRSSEWTMPNGELGVSTRFTFARRQSVEAQRPNLDELLALVDQYDPPRLLTAQRQGDHTLIIALGDMQFGKADGDGVAGTLQRTISCIDKAADLLAEYRKRFSIGHVHLAWLGDHIEGYQSQNGANAWRTALTLTEQIRITRRVMAHAVLRLAPLVERLTVAAVPGNHGEAVRFNGKGVTRYDDSHDTDALVAVQEAVSLAPDEFGHVEFFVPDTDELTVVVECSGTVVAHAHGHQWRSGKHFEWWKGQSFNKASAMHQADVLLAGHLHHEFVDTDGPRAFIQVPAMESESTWWRHRTGTVGAPGLMLLITRDGEVPVKEVVR